MSLLRSILYHQFHWKKMSFMQQPDEFAFFYYLRVFYSHGSSKIRHFLGILDTNHSSLYWCICSFQAMIRNFETSNVKFHLIRRGTSPFGLIVGIHVLKGQNPSGLSFCWMQKNLSMFSRSCGATSLQKPHKEPIRTYVLSEEEERKIFTVPNFHLLPWHNNWMVHYAKI